MPYFKKGINLNLKVKLQLIVFLTLVLIFSSLIYKQHHKISQLVRVNHEMKIDTSKVIWGNDRGGIEFNDSLVIASYCPVIEQPKGFEEWSSGPPLIDGDDNPYIYRLGNLRVPYYLYKEANSDTIMVFSKGYTLKFLLMETGEEFSKYLDSLYKIMD
jgi:hypothetical protein